MAHITLQAIDPPSKVVKSIGYDPDYRTLAVELHASPKAPAALYYFYDVPPELHDGFLSAQSKGTFYWRTIAMKFDARDFNKTAYCNKCGDLGLRGCACDDCGCGTYCEDQREG